MYKVAISAGCWGHLCSAEAVVTAVDLVGYLPRLLRVILNGVDAVFSPEDPLPFLGLHYLQIPMLLLGNLVRGNPWKKVDLCIGKIAELYGD